MTSDTGVFWFFAPTNLELMVKVLDGSTINGYFWFFSGALSSVEYTITVTDTSNNAVKTYHNDEPNFGSIADVSAFPATPATSAEHPASATTASVPHGSGAFQSTASTAAAEPCVAVRRLSVSIRVGSRCKCLTSGIRAAPASRCR
jgi:hypothetical protein